MGLNEKYRILVAEDNPINIQVAKYLLTPISAEIDFVMNGEDAINYWLKKQYDFILMDMKMPIMDGCEATQKIRQIEADRGNNSRIPIIAMTASSIFDEAISCKEAGMDGFISKPYSIGDILNILKTIQ